jgi:hypothetical protein
MSLYFNILVRAADLDPSQIALVRHTPAAGRNALDLWRYDRDVLDAYQAVQLVSRRKQFDKPIWAVFGAVGDGRTVFLGLYGARYIGPASAGDVDAITKAPLDPEKDDRYDLMRMTELADYGGRLFIDWGRGALAWVQKGVNEKLITELYAEQQEPPFPGHLDFSRPLSGLSTLPTAWQEVLRATRGVYLLVCPKCGKQYVGKADGADGFWGRWQSYIATGHGGNIGMKAHGPQDYQVNILELSGSDKTAQDISDMETRWKAKLKSIEHGLNRN